MRTGKHIIQFTFEVSEKGRRSNPVHLEVSEKNTSIQFTCEVSEKNWSIQLTNEVGVKNIFVMTRAEATQVCLPYSHGDTRMVILLYIVLKWKYIC